MRYLFALAPLALACVSRFPTPYPAERLAVETERPDKGLVHYLIQQDPDVRACNPKRPGRSVARVDHRVRQALVRAMERRIVPVDTAERCLGVWLDVLPEGEATDLAALLLERIQRRLKSADDAVTVAMIGLVSSHRVELPMQPALRLLQTLGAGPQPAALASLRTTIEADFGYLDGAIVTAERLEQESRQSVLRIHAERSPDLQVAKVAARRLFDLRWAALPDRWRRGDADDAWTTVQDRGANEVDLQQSPVLDTAWQPSDDVPTILRVQAVPDARGAALRVSTGTGQSPVERTLALGSSLHIQTAGYGALDLCAPRDRWDPTPCIAASSLSLDSGYARLDGSQIVFDTQIDLTRVVDLLASDRASLPLRVGGKQVRDLHLGLHLDPVPRLDYSGWKPGDAGPKLIVDIYEASNGRFIVHSKKEDGGDVRGVLVERADTYFRVASLGAHGKRGSEGKNGAPGAAGKAGSPARCPSTRGGDGGQGSRGGDGGSGGRGTDGGDGGNIRATVHCSSSCTTARQVASAWLQSMPGLGGPAGRAGKGGTGGAGGRGGSSATCADGRGKSEGLAGGAPGRSGPDGRDGQGGTPGVDGKRGAVRITVDRR